MLLRRHTPAGRDALPRKEVQQLQALPLKRFSPGLDMSSFLKLLPEGSGTSVIQTFQFVPSYAALRVYFGQRALIIRSSER